MDSNEIRNRYLDFYKKRGHAIIPSASLIPENDPSLLFVNSGMFPLIPYLLGEDHPNGKRLVNFQRSFRSDDIEEIGDKRHTTFFEMIGNWSLGDYFKAEQLNWWFEFLIDELGLDPKRLYQSVYGGGIAADKDEESVLIMKKIYSKYGLIVEEGPETRGKGEVGPGVEIDFAKYKIFAYGDKNWWKRGDAIGELGGPDSETFYDTLKKHNSSFGVFCHLNCDCGRFLEIGNSVFMQYQKTADGWQELKNKNVDFGGGLERLAMIKKDFQSIFQTDLFEPIINKIEDLSGKKYIENIKPFEVIADHLKAVTFIIGDANGVVPSNKEQGYFVRRLIRRALRYGRQIDIRSDSWMKKLSIEVIKIYKENYPELEKKANFIFTEIEKEEKRFNNALGKGLKEFEKLKDSKIISGEKAFDLYQEYGFPIEMIEELAIENGQRVDRDGFVKEFNKHKELSQTASAGFFKGGLADSGEKTTRLHTATHLLLAALRSVLGEKVVQKGSNITAERLRFDFSYPNKMTAEEIKKVEDLVNSCIKADLDVKKEEMSLKVAISLGAMASFGERYSDQVKVYSIIDASGNLVSKEICHGPHVKRTSEIGELKIIKEESCSFGVRRIRAVIEEKVETRKRNDE